jgi:hypothetical protein
MINIEGDVSTEITYMDREAFKYGLTGCPRCLREDMAAISSSESYGATGREWLCNRPESPFINLFEAYQVFEW